MTSTEEAHPVKRRPGRPRRVVSQELVDDSSDAWRTPDPLSGDERIGEAAGGPDCTGITFEDGREYRIENGVIVERVR